VAGGQWSVTGKSEMSSLATSHKPLATSSNPQSPIPNPSSLSTTHYPLFTVRTPTAVVTDLGTEFGVEVVRSGETTSHVFRGSVRVQMLAGDGKSQGAARVLHENQSARVERSGGKQGGNRVVVFVPASMPSNFVRQIPQRTIRSLDLVDVVAGGDGFSGRRNHGIDVTNGRPTDMLPKDPNTEFVGDGKYHHVEELPFVDGVFIPDGRLGPTRIDSAGHIFGDFPVTCNRTGAPIWAAGTIPAVQFPNRQIRVRTTLGDTDYASSGHGLLFMPGNQGITFDLDAIRRANPGHKLVRFRAVTGNTEDVSGKGYPNPLFADVWVLVDGQVRFRRREINGYTGAFSIAFPIAEKDHFLTLMATDGGNGIEWDWIVFGDPRIEVVPRQP
jgi:hypothetical protein